MIRDFAATETPTSFDCDLCIIGAGAAGLAIASEFTSSAKRVVLLESGGRTEDPATQALYDSVVTGHAFGGVHSGRFRVLGGSTARWAGQSLPYKPMDLAARPWVPHSGWPLEFDELADYYAAASRFLLTDELNFDSDMLDMFGVNPPSFDEGLLTYHFAKWSPRPNLWQAHGRPIEAADQIEVLIHANVVDLRLDESGKMLGSVEIASLGGRRGTVTASHFVICAGGIETARLLLASNRQLPSGIGNENDLVGRYFQDHPSTEIGILEANDADLIQHLFNLFHRRRRKYSVRFSAGDELQRKKEILNASASIMFDAGTDSPFSDLRSLYHLVRTRTSGSEPWRTAARVIRNFPAVAHPLYEYFVKSRTYTPNAKLVVSVMTEQAPNPDSRVTLHSSIDRLGMRRAEIRWNLTPLTLKTVREFATVIRDQFKHAGLGTVQLADWLGAPTDDWAARFSDQNHHIGTCRMSDSPETGVVDRDCRLHSVANLYIASSAVFPTGSHSNPTLTILALAKRLAERLQRIV